MGSKLRTLILYALAVIVMFMLVGCGRKRIDLSDYLNSTLEYYKSNANEHVTYQEDTGVYLNEAGTIQIELKDNVVWQIGLIASNKKYSIYGVVVGSTQKAGEKAIEDVFTSNPKVTKDEATKGATYVYQSGNTMLTMKCDAQNKITAVYIELTGYSVGNVSDGSGNGSNIEKGDIVLKVDDIEVSYSEAMVYLLVVQQRYEQEFGNEVWSYDIGGDGTTIGQVLKSKVLDQIIQLEIICSEANKQGVVLNDDEMLQVRDDAAKYMETISEQEQVKYGITEELAVQVFAANAVAKKMYETMTIDVDTNVSDEDAKEITVEMIHLKNYGVDSKGNRTVLTDSELKSVKDKMNEIYKEAKKTEDFSSLANKNSEDDQTKYTIGKQDLEATLSEAAFQLKTGELSKVLETEDGYYLIYCLDDYDEDATLQKKEEIIEQRRSDLFVELYTQWTADYKVKVDSKLWSKVDLAPIE